MILCSFTTTQIFPSFVLLLFSNPFHSQHPIPFHHLFARVALSVYFNGSLARTMPGNGVPLRWTDTTALFLGGNVQQVCLSFLSFCTPSPLFLPFIYCMRM